ncbi:S-layer homology domain-containing protein [Evtepia sp.]|uniref:S-layer homology domain-containing protein n=1 Tax=Evtepia sp. TaxID=2773933 RepID=UPI003999A5C0
MTILYRYAEAKGYDVSASADLSGYPDADQVQDYAQPAMAWAVAENIIQGMEDGTLKPAGNASRAQIATILMRFCEDVAQ